MRRGRHAWWVFFISASAISADESSKLSLCKMSKVTVTVAATVTPGIPDGRRAGDGSSYGGSPVGGTDDSQQLTVDS